MIDISVRMRGLAPAYDGYIRHSSLRGLDKNHSVGQIYKTKET